MNNSNHKKETSRQFKPAAGTTVTYGLVIFVSVHIVGLFINAFDWVWHFPTIISLLACLVMGVAVHWLVFTFSPPREKQ